MDNYNKKWKKFFWNFLSKKHFQWGQHCVRKHFQWGQYCVRKHFQWGQHCVRKHFQWGQYCVLKHFQWESSVFSVERKIINGCHTTTWILWCFRSVFFMFTGKISIQIKNWLKAWGMRCGKKEKRHFVCDCVKKLLKDSRRDVEWEQWPFLLHANLRP